MEERAAQKRANPIVRGLFEKMEGRLVLNECIEVEWLNECIEVE